VWVDDMGIIIKPPNKLCVDIVEHAPHHWTFIDIGLAIVQIVNKSAG
jgi:hypothetical protein